MRRCGTTRRRKATMNPVREKDIVMALLCGMAGAIAIVLGRLLL